MSESKTNKEMKGKSEDTIEIPIGKIKDLFGNNGWKTLSVVLGVVVLILLIVMISGAGISGNVVSGDKAAENLLDYINAQGQGSAELVSVDKQGSFYNVVVSFNGQNVPVLVSLDGETLVVDSIPLTGNVVANTENSGSGSNVKVDVEIGDSPKKGDENAQVVLVEFTDYQCPFCQRHYQQTYNQIIQNYVETGKVLYVMKDFPLNSIHPEAQKAAEAGRCVREQAGDEGYFEYHDKLFDNQQSLGDANYKRWAREISNVNGVTFDSCIDSGKYAQSVSDDLNYGSSLGITGTPGFFINGIAVSGAQPYSVFEQIINAELGE